MPDRSADVGLIADVGPVTYGSALTFLGAEFADDINAVRLGSALVASARVSVVGRSGTTLALTAENVSDRTYLSSENRLGPPSMYALTLSVPITGRARQRKAAELDCQ
ncbi:MAG: hypothetical protein GIW99_02095 [Candidatus Eremiobacteraeota bacterium]|nr:hypothetical protein [Candidatus Eremiobacteraeota bacterium]MBC5826466.1 hypothetical protein [Candidatus Eremiobacteraeota bacterium]